MRVIYNPNEFLKKFKLDQRQLYFNRIFEFIMDLKHEKEITRNLIDKYKIKKITNTEEIYKYYLDNKGMRLLFKYEPRDNQIFKTDSGIILLAVTNHDDQGKVGRYYDKKTLNFDKFIESDAYDEELSLISSQEFEEYLGHNYMKTLPFNFERFEEFYEKVVDDDAKAIYKLSEDQLVSLNSEGPLFLLGCAGSGKTLVEISKSLANANSKLKQAYFTFTPLLRDTAQNIYDKYKNCDGIVGTTEFFSLEEFFLKELKISPNQYFQFERFKNWFKKEGFLSKYKWTRKIDVVDLWSEIRGLVKGYIGNDFFRFKTLILNSKVIHEKGFDELIEKKILICEPDMANTFFINDSEKLNDRLPKLPKLSDHIRKIEFKEYQLLDEKSYVNHMNEKYTQYDKETRHEIYKFVEKHYQKHLNENKLYDDNDLARLLINKIDLNKGKKYDYLFVDELQDLSELQVFALAKLVHNPKNILMSGDVAQTINPTFFKRGRIGLIFKNRFNVSYKKYELSENFRNSEQIVELVSKIIDIRIQKLGNDKDDIREKSTNLDRDDGLPFYLKTNRNHIETIMTTWLHIPKVAIIVSNEESKSHLRDVYNLRKTEETNIYTVQEIKGQEFDKILTFNIISDFADEWKTIMNAEIDKKGDLVYKYRYYFNLLYVAITRGRKNLFFFEEKQDLEIIKEIIDYFDIVDKNYEQILNLEGYDTDENKLNQALEHFKNEDYERAKTFYLQLNDRKNAQICTAYSFIKKGEFKKGIIGLYINKNHWEKAFEYATTKDTLLLKVLLAVKLKNLNLDEIINVLGNNKIKDLLVEYKGLKFYNVIYLDSIRLINILGNYRNTMKLKEIKYNA